MTRIAWHDVKSILTLSAHRSVESIKSRIEAEEPQWVVLRRPTGHDIAPRSAHLYAFGRKELLLILDNVPEKKRHLPTEMALPLQEDERSTVTHGRKPQSISASRSSGGATICPSCSRVVHVRTDGEPVAIGDLPLVRHVQRLEAGDKFTKISILRRPDSLNLGNFRGESGWQRNTKRRREASSRSGGRLASPDTPTRPATISAEAPAHVQLGEVGTIRYHIDAGTTPGADSGELQVDLAAEASVRVVLMLNGEAAEVVGAKIHEVDPPRPETPRSDTFEIRGIEMGDVSAALLFRQEGRSLGSLSFQITVLEHPPEDQNETALKGKTCVSPLAPDDQDLLTLLIEQQVRGSEVRYRYRLDSEGLGMNYLERTSRPLKGGSGQTFATERAFVEDLYRRVTHDVLNVKDVRRLRRTVRAVGASLCEQLFDPDVTREIWRVRDRISRIEIVSWEPYIPWELLYLQNPDDNSGKKKDGLFLAETSLIRSMPGLPRARNLPMRRWAYLAAEYTAIDEEPVGGEVEYLRSTLPERDINPEPIPGTYDAFFDALEEGDFDVLHLACHGRSDHEAIDSATLLIGDLINAAGKGEPVSVDALTVRQEGRLASDSLVFLNACESGRLGPSLTTWGGWPTAFLNAGAGAFVGTSWPVREKPAAAFTRAFYEALLEGETLSAAATTARNAIRNMGDASWLAYKVYGHPFARRTPS